MRKLSSLAMLLACLLFVAACGSTDEAGTAEESAQTQPQEEQPASNTGENNAEFFDQEQMNTQLEQRSATPEGPEGKPWEQYIDADMVDTSEYAKQGGGNVCFSNASIDNPWRQVGWKTMQEEVKLHDNIKNFRVQDAEASDETQISDVEQLSRGQCDVLIVSPNTTKTLTPAVEAACERVPVVVFDRGVETDCPVTFVHPIGGYAFGADAAEFLKDNVEEGGKILALRILPGVDVLETRWSGAKKIFDDNNLNVVGVEFTDGDPAKTKSIVSDYLQREGELGGVWMDAGATSVPAIEAFEDAGQEVPPITGEDQQDFLTKWKEDGLTAVAPTYPTYQWRTAIIAASKILDGEEVPREWVLPQPKIDESNLDRYIQPDMPPLHYALCGCEDMANFPDAWK